MVKFELVNEKTGAPINVGDTVATFRDETVTVTGWPDTGRNRVYVKHANMDGETEYFPGVIRAKLVRKES